MAAAIQSTGVCGSGISYPELIFSSLPGTGTILDIKNLIVEKFCTPYEVVSDRKKLVRAITNLTSNLSTIASEIALISINSFPKDTTTGISLVMLFGWCCLRTLGSANAVHYYHFLSCSSLAQVHPAPEASAVSSSPRVPSSVAQEEVY